MTTRGGKTHQDGSQQLLVKPETEDALFGGTFPPTKTFRLKQVSSSINHCSASSTCPHGPAAHSTLHGLGAAADGVGGLLRLVLRSLRAEEPSSMEARRQASPGAPGLGRGPPRTQKGFS